MPDLPPVSVSTVVLDGQSFERGLDLLVRAGARVVEPAFIEGYMPFDETTFTERNGLQLARSLQHAGLSARAVSAHTDLGHSDSLEKLRRRLDFAAALGAGILISNATTEGRSGAFGRLMDAIAPDLASRDLVLALENPGHGAGALLPDGARGAAVIGRLGNPRIRMNYDIGNAATYGARTGTAAEDLDAALPVAAHLHLKDLRAVGADWQFCPVGQGEVGYGMALAPGRIPAALPMGLEHPIRLWRPGRGDPVRRADVPGEQAVIDAVRAALDFVAACRPGRPGATDAVG